MTRQPRLNATRRRCMLAEAPVRGPTSSRTASPPFHSSAILPFHAAELVPADGRREEGAGQKAQERARTVDLRARRVLVRGVALYHG